MSDDSVDLVIIGSGPAGMAAACEARSIGLAVTVLDEQATIGGQIYRAIETAPADRVHVLGPDYIAGRKLASEFRRSGAHCFGGATVWNLAADGTVDYVADSKTAKIISKYALIATGAMERPFPISGWTLPGVLGAGAAQILLKGSGALPTAPVILAGCGPLLYLLAWQYLRAGATIRAVVDTMAPSAYLKAMPFAIGALGGWRDLAKGIKLLSALRRSNVPVFSGCTDLSILGEDRAEGISFTYGDKRQVIAASLVLLHQGVVPNNQLSLSTGLPHRWDKVQLCWQPITDSYGRLGESSIYVAGDSRAIVGAQASAVQGRLAALAIGERLDVPFSSTRRKSLKHELKRYTYVRPFLDALYQPNEENRIPRDDNVIVCRCEEVTAGQIRRCVELGCLGPNQTKAFVRSGMGPCQGRFCGLTVTEIIAEARGADPSDVGHYRVRAPVKPILLGELAE